MLAGRDHLWHDDEDRHAGEQRTDAAPDEQPAHRYRGRRDRRGRSDREPDGPGCRTPPHQRGLAEARGTISPTVALFATSTTPAPTPWSGPDEESSDGRSERAKATRRGVGHQAAELDGPSPDPVRETTDGVLHEHRRQEKRRHRGSDKREQPRPAGAGRAVGAGRTAPAPATGERRDRECHETRRALRSRRCHKRRERTARLMWCSSPPGTAGVTSADP